MRKFEITILFISLLGFIKDSPAQWFNLVTGVPDNLYSVYFSNRDTGIAVGGSLNHSTILRTINGGNSWQSLNLPQSKWLYDIEFINDSTGITCGYNGVIYKTTNYGETWSAKPSEVTEWLYSIDFINEDTGYIVGIDGRIIKTTNGGNNWTIINNPINSWLLDIQFWGSSIAYACGEDGRIFKSTNSGLNWEEKINPINNTLNDIWIVNADSIFIVGEFGTIMFSADSGVTWNPVFSNTTQNLKAIHFRTRTHGFIVGETIILQTLDGGQTWNPMTNPVTTGLFGIHILKNTTTAYAVGKSGTIIKNDFTIGIDEIQSEEYIQVFPNPAGDYIYITMNLQTIPSNIKILDVNGKTIETLKMNQPSTNYPIGLKQLSKGMYYILIETQNQKRFVKKIIHE